MLGNLISQETLFPRYQDCLSHGWDSILPAGTLSMKIALVQLNPKVGDFERNARLVLDRAREAEAAGADIRSFSRDGALRLSPPRPPFLSFLCRGEREISSVLGPGTAS